VNGGGATRESTLTVEPVDDAIGTTAPTLRQQTATGAAWMASATLVQALLQLLVVAILSRIVDRAQFGLIAGAQVVVGFAQILANSGIGLALVQRPTISDATVRAAVTLQVLTGVAIWVALAVAAAPLEDLLRLEGLAPIIRGLGGVFLIQNLSVSGSLLARRLAFSKIAFCDLVSYAFGYGLVSVVCALSGLGAWAIVLGQICDAALRALMLFVIQPHSMRPLLSRSETAALFRFGGGQTASVVGTWIAGQGDNAVVGRYLGAATLGLYSRAYMLMMIPAMLIGSAFDRVLFPAMASVQDDKRRLRVAVTHSLGTVALLSLPATVIAVVLSRDVVITVLGDEWVPMHTCFAILGVGVFLRTASRIADGVARASGAVGALAGRKFVFAAAVLAGSVIGKQAGINGVAWGVLGALLVNLALTMQLAIRLTDASVAAILRAHAPAIIAAAIAGTAAAGARWSGGIADLPSAATVALAVALAGGGLIAWLRWASSRHGSTYSLVRENLELVRHPRVRGLGAVIGRGYFADRA